MDHLKPRERGNTFLCAKHELSDLMIRARKDVEAVLKDLANFGFRPPSVIVEGVHHALGYSVACTATFPDGRSEFYDPVDLFLLDMHEAMLEKCMRLRQREEACTCSPTNQNPEKATLNATPGGSTEETPSDKAAVSSSPPISPEPKPSAPISTSPANTTSGSPSNPYGLENTTVLDWANVKPIPGPFMSSNRLAFKLKKILPVTQFRLPNGLIPLWGVTGRGYELVGSGLIDRGEGIAILSSLLLYSVVEGEHGFYGYIETVGEYAFRDTTEAEPVPLEVFFEAAEWAKNRLFHRQG